MHRLKKLYPFLKGNINLYIWASVFSCLAVIVSIISPLVIKVFIDSVIGYEPFSVPSWINTLIVNYGGRDFLLRNLWIGLVVYVSLTVIQGLLQFMKDKLYAKTTEDITKRIRDALYINLQHLFFEEHVKAQTGDWLQRCSSDVDTFRRFTASELPQIALIICKILITFFVMLSINVKLTLFSLCAFPPLFIFTYVFFKRIQTAFLRVENAEAEASTVLQENLTGVRVVKAFARQDYEIEKFDKKNSLHKDEVYKVVENMAMYWSSSDLICMIQLCLTSALSIYWAYNGYISLGTVVVFILYVKELLWPIRNLGRVLSSMGQALVVIDRIFELLDKPKENFDEGIKDIQFKGNIIFKNVSFRYNDEQEILNKVSFEVKQGQTIGILGPTGCGKSSLLSLLTRLYDCTEGEIIIDGYNIKDINKKWLRENIGIVLQEPFLFSKTIKDNITIAKSNAHEEDVYHVAEIAAIHNSILEFDKGYDTLVGEKGVTLSGGQKQRIAIARAIINNHPILIFDDSLSAVDMETDNKIRTALNKRSHNVTTFIISHRINTIKHADLILVMDNGKIVHKGTHDELIKGENMYSRIWNIQSTLGEKIETVAH